MKMLEC